MSLAGRSLVIARHFHAAFISSSVILPSTLIDNFLSPFSFTSFQLLMLPFRLLFFLFFDYFDAMPPLPLRVDTDGDILR